MGRASLKENKNIYQLSREGCGLTRAQAAEKLEWITDSRIEKIENDRVCVTPEEVVAMQRVYKRPTLCSWYCANACAIGREGGVREAEEKSLSEAVLEILAAINTLDKQKERLIEITCDGKIDDDEELRDFVAISKQLERIQTVAGSLKLWLDSTVEAGEVDKEKLRKLLEG